MSTKKLINMLAQNLTGLLGEILKSLSNVQIKWNFVAKSNLGKKYKRMEDAFVLPVSNEKYQVSRPDVWRKGYLFVLADGVGGSNAGDVAAELASNWVFKEYYLEEYNQKQVNRFLAEIIQSVNLRISALAAEHPEYQGMGTTLVTALFSGKKIHICSVGDSRIYRYRAQKLEQINEDQSEVWELYKAGAITKDDIRHHPRNNIITQVVGVPEKIDINQYTEPVDPNGLYLMCSDGLTDMVPEVEIASILAYGISLEDMADKLITRANEYGGKDNITLILIHPGLSAYCLGFFPRLLSKIKSVIK